MDLAVVIPKGGLLSRQKGLDCYHSKSDATAIIPKGP